MSILDDFEGVLSTEEISKIKASPVLRNRLEKGDELLRYYTEGDEAPPIKIEKTDPPARTTPSGDLSDLTKTLGEITAKLGNVVTKDDLEATLTKRGNELAQAASSRALKQSDELNRIYRRHEKDFGEEFDSTKFDTWADEQMKAGHQFNSVTAAYEDFTAPQRTKAEIEKGVREGLKVRNAENQGAQVPGVTPPSSKSPIATFMRRGKEADGENKTAVDRAGAALAARRSSQSEA